MNPLRTLYLKLSLYRALSKRKKLRLSGYARPYKVRAASGNPLSRYAPSLASRLVPSGFDQAQGSGR